MDRRDVMAGMLAGAGTAILPGAANARIRTLGPRMGCTVVSFRDRFPVRPKTTLAAGQLQLLQAPQFLRDTFGLRQLELWNLQFPDTSPEYCNRLRTAAVRAGGQFLNIQLDGGYNLSSSDPDKRGEARAFIKMWMDRARLLGARSVRANIDDGRPTIPFDPALLVPQFREIAEYGRSIGVRILIENHIGHSAKIDNVVTLLKAIDHPWCRALADWGNSSATTPEERVADVSKLFPWLDLVSAKGMHFDPTSTRHLDYPIEPLVRATEASGYRGIYSIELWATENMPEPVPAMRSMLEMVSPLLRNPPR